MMPNGRVFCFGVGLLLGKPSPRQVNQQEMPSQMGESARATAKGKALCWEGFGYVAIDGSILSFGRLMVHNSVSLRPAMTCAIYYGAVDSLYHKQQ